MTDGQKPDNCIPHGRTAESQRMRLPVLATARYLNHRLQKIKYDETLQMLEALEMFDEHRKTTTTASSCGVTHTQKTRGNHKDITCTLPWTGLHPPSAGPCYASMMAKSNVSNHNRLEYFPPVQGNAKTSKTRRETKLRCNADRPEHKKEHML